MSKIPLVPLSDLPKNGLLPIEIDGIAILVGQANGEVFAIRDRCPHALVPLRTGKIDGTEITCARHGWVFDVLSGDSVPGPTPYCLHKYTVEIISNKVYLVDF